MRNLWRATAYLFWQHPVLWLPLIVADLTAFCIESLKRLLTHQIVLWLVQRHSASILSSGPEYSDQASASVKAALLTLPFIWGTYFLSILLYTMAMLATAAILHNLSVARDTNLPAVAPMIWSSMRRALVLSIKLLALCATSALLFGPLIILSLTFGSKPFWQFPTFLFSELLTTLVMVGISYLITPSALRLIQYLNPSVGFQWTYGQGRLVGAAAVVVSAGLSLLLQKAEPSILRDLHPHGSAFVYMINAVISLIVAFPYIPLFIALYLIARPDSPLANAQTDQSEAIFP
jgi:hypothetical protein